MKNNFTHIWKMLFFACSVLFYSLGSLQAQCPSAGITLTTGACQAPTLPNDSVICTVTFSLGQNMKLGLQNVQPNITYEAYYANTPGSFVTVFDTNNIAIAWGTAPVQFTVPGVMTVTIQNNTDGTSCGSFPTNEDLTVRVPDPCSEPVNLSSSNITSFTADISWNTQDSGIAWEYLLMPQGSAPSGSGTVIVDSSASLTNLTGETDYDLFVRQACTPGDSSSWAGPHSFSTDPCPSTNVTADLGSDTTVCEGDNFLVTLDAGNPGSTYLWNTNQTTQNISVSQSGNYWVKVFDAQGCSSVDTVEVIESAPPVPDLGSDRKVCLNETLNETLDAGVYAAYAWSSGGTSQNETADEYGEYRVTVTNSIGCSGTDTILVDSLPVPDVHVEDETICPGDSVLLLAPFGFATYNWSTGSQNQSTMVSEEGTYTLIVTNDSGCADTTMSYVTVIDLGLDLGADTTVREADTLILSAPQSMVSYLWNTGEMTSNLAVDESNAPGEFWVMIEDSNGCEGTDSIFVDLIPGVGIDENEFNSSRFYPNPVMNSAQLELNLSAEQDIIVQVLSITGKEVLNKRISADAGKTVHTLNFDGLTKGMYVLNVYANDKKMFSKKVTKL